MNTRIPRLVLLSLALAASCSAPDSPERDAEPPDPETSVTCGAGPTTEGVWTTLPQPEEVVTLGAIPGVVFSDEERLWATNGLWLGTLEPDAWEWSVSETVPTSGSRRLTESRLSAGGDWLFGWSVEGSVLQLEVLNLSSEIWTSHAIPAAIASVVSAGDRWIADEQEFAVPLAEFRAAGSKADLFLRVAFFDPELGTWREGPVEGVGSYAIIEAPLYTSHSTSWVGTTLYLWGPLRDASAVFMRSFDIETETWSTLPTEGGPGVRVGAGMLADESRHLFVYGGQGVSEQRPALRELWRFDLDTEVWTQIDVPRWVDPLLGVALDGKLYFIGSCTTGAVYEPATDTWEQLPELEVLGGAEGKQLRAFGDRLVVFGVLYHPHTKVPDVFLFDPLGRTPASVGGGGGEGGSH